MGQPGRSNKERKGCGAATATAISTLPITPGTGRPSIQGSAALPKKNSPEPPLALPPTGDGAGTVPSGPAGPGTSTAEGPLAPAFGAEAKLDCRPRSEVWPRPVAGQRVVRPSARRSTGPRGGACGPFPTRVGDTATIGRAAAPECGEAALAPALIGVVEGARGGADRRTTAPGDADAGRTVVAAGCRVLGVLGVLAVRVAGGVLVRRASFDVASVGAAGIAGVTGVAARFVAEAAAGVTGRMAARGTTPDTRCVTGAVAVETAADTVLVARLPTPLSSAVVFASVSDGD